MQLSLYISLVIVLIILVRFFAWRRGIYRNHQWGKVVLPINYQRLAPVYKKALQSSSYFYVGLPAQQKKEFEKRVAYFIKTHEFVPRRMRQVQPEMKALIAASAVQITFGLKNVYLGYFKKILVYPDDYYSTIHERYHRGEVNPAGKLIVLSWKAFLEGYRNPNDGWNLGLHEMAHALRLENALHKPKRKFLSPSIMEKFDQLGEIQRQNIQEGHKTLFRQYGAVNEEEFFAVAVEVFFEEPVEFRDKHPELYSLLTQLLKQDPAKGLHTGSIAQGA